MSKCYITLPNGRRCGLGVYVKAWRTLLSWADRELHGAERRMWPGFSYGAESTQSILYAMRGGLSERINRHIPGYGQGRKWDNDYFIRLWRDSRRLQDIARRVRVYQFETDEARLRFAHLLASHEES